MAYVVTRKVLLVEVNGKEYYDHDIVGIGKTATDAKAIILREVAPTKAKSDTKLIIDALWEALGAKITFGNKYKEDYNYEGDFEVESYEEEDE